MRPGRSSESLHLLAIATGAALIIAAVATAQDYASRSVEGLPASWFLIGRTQALTWLAWAVLVPAIRQTSLRLRTPAGGLAARASGWFALAVVACFVHAGIEVAAVRLLGWIPTSMSFPTMLLARFSGTAVANGIVFCCIALVLALVEHQREVRAREHREAKLQSALARAQLQVIRTQIQPHFLFNALHTVSALLEDPPAARAVLVRLSDLLRRALAFSDADEVPLREEMGFIESYLEIQRSRFGSRLSTRLEVEPDTLSALVPSLLLQPIVENAVRHGIEPRPGGGMVWIAAARAGDSLLITIGDDGPGLDESASQSGTGMGLANTRARLEHHYPGRHTFELLTKPSGGLVVAITLPFLLPAVSGGRE